MKVSTGKFVFMLGNVSEGFTAYGPYDSLDEACDTWEGAEGWAMELFVEVCDV